jgi:hypothetical protein
MDDAALLSAGDEQLLKGRGDCVHGGILVRLDAA